MTTTNKSISAESNDEKTAPIGSASVAVTASAPADSAQVASGSAGAVPVADEGAPRKTFDRRTVLAMTGTGLVGLIAGGFLATWGVTSDSIAAGRVTIRSTPLKMIVTDRARCSGCQRCEIMCTLRNDGRVSPHIARVRVWDNYNFGASVDTGDGIFNNCQFTIEHCKQCDDPMCMKYCPAHAIVCDPDTGARVVDTDRCIGCGMCAEACPWNMPRIDSETGHSTKCISCGRCAEQCPNGAIKFIDWVDIAQKVIDQGVVRTVTLVEA